MLHTQKACHTDRRAQTSNPIPDRTKSVRVFETRSVLVLSGWKQPRNMVLRGFAGRFLPKGQAHPDDTSSSIVGVAGC
jgi:hypothetical protein